MRVESVGRDTLTSFVFLAHTLTSFIDPFYCCDTLICFITIVFLY